MSSILYYIKYPEKSLKYISIHPALTGIILGISLLFTLILTKKIVLTILILFISILILILIKLATLGIAFITDNSSKVSLNELCKHTRETLIYKRKIKRSLHIHLDNITGLKIMSQLPENGQLPYLFDEFINGLASIKNGFISNNELYRSIDSIHGYSVLAKPKLLELLDLKQIESKSYCHKKFVINSYRNMRKLYFNDEKTNFKKYYNKPLLGFYLSREDLIKLDLKKMREKVIK